MYFLIMYQLMRLSHHHLIQLQIATPVAGSPIIVKADSSCGGTFAIPDPTVSGNPKFATGVLPFKVTSSSTNERNAVSTAQTNYHAEGILETRQETIIATRNGRVCKRNSK